MQAKVNIRGEQWTIKLKALKGCDGQTDKEGRTIELKKNLAREEWLPTLVHEALHACQWDLDESAVLEMEQAIVQVIRKGTAILEMGNG